MLSQEGIYNANLAFASMRNILRVIQKLIHLIKLLYLSS
ncbi:hypothetical protein A1OE_1476 [Candidatus Endolissoclinum faulkneri L2]|uniref:Uncharacterized protein n=1 Tax=Candidatus Endolissoclinum faulkneri L2 TaxID=1193729 RepID=K7YJ26_9PROT|nr:hypothetical protein A1OE_1476 [Candidatus Endolissoclinum faulkneri L2]